MIKIVIDAGHGKNTPGKRCPKALDPRETREWSLNNNVAVRLIKILSLYECEIIRADDPTGEKDISLKERCDKANTAGADFFLSIHHNAGMNLKSGGGIEVLCFDQNTASLGWELYRTVSKYNHLTGNRSARVIARPDLAVLRRTKMPALMLENGFMDSSTDCAIIRTNEHAQRTAEGLARFLIDRFKLNKKDDNALNGDYYIIAADDLSEDAADYLMILLNEYGFKKARKEKKT